MWLTLAAYQPMFLCGASRAEFEEWASFKKAIGDLTHDEKVREWRLLRWMIERWGTHDKSGLKGLDLACTNGKTLHLVCCVAGGSGSALRLS